MVLASAGFPAMAFAQELENPVSCVESQAAALAYGDHTTGCSFGTLVDNDFFVFQGAAGDFIRLTALGTSGSVTPVVEIRDPDGVVLHDGACSLGCEPPAFSVHPSPSLEKSGPYQLRLYESGGNNVGDYVLQLERIPPQPLPLLTPFDAPLLDTLAPQIDNDFIAFHGTQGTMIRLLLLGTSGSVTPHLEIRDPAEVLLHDCNTSVCPSPIEPAEFSIQPSPSNRIESSGTHVLTISEAGKNNAGNYEVSINCLFGSCDSDGDGRPDPEPPLLPYDFTVERRIDPLVDMDVFTFAGRAETIVQIDARGVSGSVTPLIEVLDPDGVVLHRGSSFPVEPAEFSLVPSASNRLEKTGSYRIALSESGFNNVGDYQLGIQCLSLVSVPCPEVESFDAYPLQNDNTGIMVSGAPFTVYSVTADGGDPSLGKVVVTVTGEFAAGAAIVKEGDESLWALDAEGTPGTGEVLAVVGDIPGLSDVSRAGKFAEFFATPRDFRGRPISARIRQSSVAAGDGAGSIAAADGEGGCSSKVRYVVCNSEGAAWATDKAELQTVFQVHEFRVPNDFHDRLRGPPIRDFAQIKGIQLEFFTDCASPTDPAPDWYVDAVEVPEPSSGLLRTSALLCLAALARGRMRSRRR